MELDMKEVKMIKKLTRLRRFYRFMDWLKRSVCVILCLALIGGFFACVTMRGETKSTSARSTYSLIDHVNATRDMYRTEAQDVIQSNTKLYEMFFVFQGSEFVISTCGYVIGSLPSGFASVVECFSDTEYLGGVAKMLLGKIFCDWSNSYAEKYLALTETEVTNTQTAEDAFFAMMNCELTSIVMKHLTYDLVEEYSGFCKEIEQEKEENPGIDLNAEVNLKLAGIFTESAASSAIGGIDVEILEGALRNNYDADEIKEIIGALQDSIDVYERSDDMKLVVKLIEDALFLNGLYAEVSERWNAWMDIYNQIKGLESVRNDTVKPSTAASSEAVTPTTAVQNVVETQNAEAGNPGNGNVSGFVPRTVCPSKDDPNYSSNIFDRSGWGMFQLGGNCTAYCYGRQLELGVDMEGKYAGLFLGNANTWLDQAKAAGISTGTEPRLGAIACFKGASWNGNYGHLAVVESLDNGIMLSESHYGYALFMYRSKSVYAASDLAGYIYLYGEDIIEPTTAYVQETVAVPTTAHVQETVVEPTTVHVHSYNRSEQMDPFCFREGRKTYYCACGYSYSEVLPALEHSFQLTESGKYNHYKCTGCSETYEELNPLWVEPTTITHTYKKDGNGYHVCEDCGKAEMCAMKLIDPYPEQTCEAPVTVRRQCSTCGYMDYVTIPETGHSYKENGSGQLVCEDCGTVKEPETTVHSHSFTNYVSNNDATCQKNGSETAYCDGGCGASDRKVIEGTKTGHSFTNYIYNNNADSKKNGTETAVCDFGCGASDTREVAGTQILTSVLGVSTTDNGNGTITLSWSGNLGFVRYQICRYTDGAMESIEETANTSIQLEKLPGPNIFQVYGIDGSGCIYIDPANKVSVGVSTEPINLGLCVVEQGADYVKLSWNNDTSQRIAPFSVWYSSDGWQHRYEDTELSTSTITGLSAGTYRIEIIPCGNDAYGRSYQNDSVTVIIN